MQKAKTKRQMQQTNKEIRKKKKTNKLTNQQSIELMFTSLTILTCQNLSLLIVL